MEHLSQKQIENYSQNRVGGAELLAASDHLGECEACRARVEAGLDVEAVEVGADVVGICLDTANVMLRLEDPLEAARRLAPHVVMTHVKDAALLFHEAGLRWQCRPCALLHDRVAGPGPA